MRQPFPLAALALSAASALTTLPAHAQPLTDAFTYQGHLSSDAQPLITPTTVRFRLFNAPTGGQQVAPAITTTVTPDASGVFSLPLNFGPAFGPEARYLEIALPDPNSPAQFIPLTPRTTITPTPVAHFARSAPIPTLAQVSSNLLSHQPGGYVDLSAGDSFFDGLRIFNNIDRGLILSRPGIQSTLALTINTSEELTLDSAGDFIIRSDAGSGSIEAPAGITLESGSTKVEVTQATIDLQAATLLEIGATSIDIEAASQLSITAGILQLDGGTSFINGHVFLTSQAIINGTLQTTTGLMTTLQVNGNASKPGGGPWSVLSDARHKKNIVPLHDSLATLNALRPVSYEYADTNHPLRAPGAFRGFIAQEVRTVLPEWVTTDEDGTLLLTPLGFEALAVDALQQLHTLHQHETASLRDEIARLHDRLDRLERTLSNAP